MDSPWTTPTRRPPPAHTLAPLAHKLHRTNNHRSRQDKPDNPCAIKPDSSICCQQFGADSDTAKSNTHYTPGSNLRYFDPSSAASKSEPVGRISVPTFADDVLDGDKTLTLSIAELFDGVSTVLPFRPAPGGGSATATIRDDEAYHLSVLDAVGDEGDAAGVKVTLSKPVERDITVRFRTREGTARAPGDFTACTAKDVGCALVVPAGETEAQLRVPTTEDAVPEETEQFRVVIAEVDFADIIIDRRAAVVKIRDDDARSVAISGLADVSAPENSAWTSPTPVRTGTPDGGVAWTLEGDDAARFTIDPDTGELTLPAQNFEAPADRDGDNVYDITVRVTDEDGNTATVALSVTVTDVVYGQIDVNAGVPWTGRAIAGEGAPVRASFAYKPYGTQGDVAGRPGSVALRWRLGGLGGAGAASAGDLSLSGAGGPASLQYKAGAASLVELARTIADAIDEPAVETFRVELRADNDDVVFHDAVSGASTTTSNLNLDFGIRDGFAPALVINRQSLRVQESDIASTRARENEQTWRVKLNFAPVTDATVAMSLPPETTRIALDKSSLTFTSADWSAWQTVKVSAVDDSIENDPPVQEIRIGHSVTGAGGLGVAAGSVAVSVYDDDAPNVISIDSPSVTEGDSGDTDITWTVTLQRLARQNIVLFAGPNSGDRGTTIWHSSGGKLDHRFGFGAKVVNFNVGDSRKTFGTKVIGDVRHEGDETIKLQVTVRHLGDGSPFAPGIRHPAPQNPQTGYAYALVTGEIADDDDAPDGIALTLTPSETKGNLGDTATSTREDRGTRSLTAQAAVLGDTTYGEDKTVTVTVGADGDSAVAGTDYTAIDPIEITIEEGEASASAAISLAITDDTLDEADEAITFTPEADDSGIDIAAVTHTITDDDDAPTVSVADAAAVDEGDDPAATTDMTFSVTLSAASGKAVTVPYTLGGTAAADDDYTDPATKSVTIAAGDTEADIAIPVKGDEIDEANETVIVTLGAPTNATVSTAEGAGTATGTITDDDATPTALVFTVSASSQDTQAVVAEGGGEQTVRVTAKLQGTTTFAEDKDIAVVIGKSTDSAVEGTDYETVDDLTLALSAGEKVGHLEFALTPTDDAIDEDDEVISIEGSIGDLKVTFSSVTITDDDGAPTVSVGDATAVSEGDDPEATADMTFTVTLSAASGKVVTVPYSLTGTATADDDYDDPDTKSVTIAAGQTTGTITIAVKGDEIDEANETVVVTLGAPTNATIGTAEGAGTGTGTITDDDTRGVTVAGAPLTLAEADDGTTENAKENEASYTVVLDSEPTGSVTVAITNPANSPVTLDTTTLTFTAGNWDDPQTVTVTALDDAIDNPNDRRAARIAHAVSGGGYGATENFRVAVTVTDDDGAPTVSVADATAVAEGDDPATTADMTFTVTLSAASGKVVTVPYSLTGTAAADDDYDDPATKSVTIAAGQTTGTITIAVKGDEIDEANETVIVTLGSPTNAAIGRAEGAGTGTGTITDDDTATLSIADAAAAEGATATFTVTLSTPSASSVTVTATTSEGTATDPEDYTHKAQALTFAAGQTSRDFTVAIASDTLAELDETFTVTLSGATGATIADATATGTITGAGALLAVADASAAEGDALTFTVTRTGDTAKAASVQWTTGDDATEGAVRATAGADYTAQTTAQTLAFKAGDATATFTVATTEDAIDEPDETFAVTLASPSTGTAIADDAAIGTITDDDDAPDGISLSVDPASVAENAAKAQIITVTATVSGGTTYADAKTVTVSVGEGNDSAVSGTDYAAVPDFDITIAAGQASGTGTFSLDPSDDALAEGAETLTVSGAAGALDVTDAEVAITDNDAAPSAFTLAVDADTGANGVQTSVAEGGGAKTARVTATLGGATAFATDREVTVKVGKATDTATEGTDYAEVADLTITIAAGASSAHADFTLTPTDDAIDEPNESISVEGSLGDIDATGPSIAITDDDAAPSLSIDSPSVAEGNSGTAKLTFTVTLSAPSGRAVTVAYADAGTGTATSGTDYAAVTAGTLTFAAGDTSKTIDVTVNGDTTDEPNETVALRLSNPSNATVAAADGTGTITDDDGAPTVSVANAAAVAEGDDPAKTTDMTFPVTLSAASGKAVTVAYALAGTAAADADYADPAAKSVTIAAGQTTADIVIPVKGDETDEPNETVIVTLGTPTNATIASTETATGTITDDDTRGVTIDPTSKALTLAETDNSATENAKENEASYTVALDSEPTATVTVAITNPRNSPVTLDKTSLTFTAATWDDPQTVTVTAVDDAIDNTDDKRAATLAHAVSGGGYGAAENFSVSVTVTDDDATPTALTLTADADAGAEGVQSALAEDGGAKTARVTATLAGATTFATATTVTVAVGAPADSATEGADYAAVADQTITIAAGQSSGQADFTLTPTQDALAEGTETISLDGSATGLTVTGAQISLTDDDAAPTGIALSVSPAAVGEGAGETGVTVTATVNGATRYPEAKTVRVTVGGGTAASGTDYAAVAAFDITIGAGAASAQGTFDLTPTQDALHEGTETIDVSGASSGITVTKATVSLTDDDDAPTFAIADASAAEGDALTFTVTRSGATGAAASVRWNTAADAREGAAPATAGTDYTAQTTVRTLSFAAGDTAKTFTVATTEDALDEPDETFLVKLTGAAGATVTDDEATGTITDDDDAPDGITLSVNPSSVAENAAAAATVTVTATVTGGTTYAAATAVTVSVGDSGDSAASGTDYAAVPNFTITIPAGAASATGTFSLDPTDDAIAEGAETLTVSGASGDIAVTDATVTLTDDEGTPAATLVLTPATIDESGADNASTVTATLSAPSSAALTLTVSAGAGVTPSDNKTLTIAAGETASTGTVTLIAIDNEVDAADLEVTVSAAASGGNGVANPANQTLTVTDDDDAGFALDPVALTVAEGADSSYTVALTSQPTGAVTVTVAAPAGEHVTLDGPDADSAFTKSETIEFTTGNWNTAQTVTVRAGEDDDAANDTAALTHSATGGGYNAVAGSLVVAVTDDDTPGLVFDPASLTATEGGSGSYAVALATAPSTAVTVTLTATTGLAVDTDGGTGGSQNTLSFTTTNWATGQPVTVTAADDNLHQATARTLTIAHAAAGGDYAAVTGSLSVTVTDDDGAPTVSVADATAVAEGDDPDTTADMTFTVTLSAASGKTVTVPYTLSGSAAADADYTDPATKSVTIAAGQISADIAIAVKGDEIDEANETVIVTLGSPTNATLSTAEGAGTATGTITDDDAAGAIALTISPVSVSEGAVATEVTVTATIDGTITFGVDTVIEVIVGAEIDSATEGTDYTAVDEFNVTIKAGESSGTAIFTLKPSDNDIDTDDKSISIGGTLTDATVMGATLTLADDDERGVTVTPKTLTLAEADDGNTQETAENQGKYAVMLNTKPTGTVVINIASEDNDIATVSPDRLTFTPSTWNDPQQVMVTAVADALQDNPGDKREIEITHTVDAHGIDYEDETADAVEVTVIDDDNAEPTAVTLSVDNDDPPPSIPVIAISGGPAVMEGEPACFTITADAVLAHDLVVNLTVADAPNSDFMASNDEVASKTATIRAGRASATYDVATINDETIEQDGLVTVTLASSAADPGLYTMGTSSSASVMVMDDDRIEDRVLAAWLARFGRTVAQQTLEGVAARLTAPRNPGMQGRFAGQTLPFDGIASGRAPPGNETQADTGAAWVDTGRVSGGDIAGGAGMAHDLDSPTDPSGDRFAAWLGPPEPESRVMTAREVLLGSSFSVTGETDDAGGSLAWWGRISQSNFDGREGGLSLDGDVTTMKLGADYVKDDWLAGLTVMRTSGDGDYAGGSENGRMGVSLTSVAPYAAVQASERIQLWGTLGHGAGEIAVKPATGDERYRTDMRWNMAAAGMRGDLLAPGVTPPDGPTLDLTADALWMRIASDGTHALAASQADVNRLRLGLESSWRLPMEDGAHLTPTLELGARHDGGDAETGFGIDLGGGLEWSAPKLGLSLDLSGRTLLAHDDGGLEDRGFSAGLAFDPNPASERGPSLTLGHEHGGEAEGGLDALFTSEPRAERTGSEAASRWKAEAAWGFPTSGSRFTGSPHVGLGLETTARDYTLGWRLTPETASVPDLTLGLKATRRESDTAAPQHTAGIEIRMRW